MATLSLTLEATACVLALMALLPSRSSAAASAGLRKYCVSRLCTRRWASAMSRPSALAHSTTALAVFRLTRVRTGSSVT